MKFSGYKVNRKHRSQTPKVDCTQWTISEWMELDLFIIAKNNGWVSDKTHVWAIDGKIGNYKQIGTNGSDLAYMAKYVVDHNDEWHGYPVVPYRQADRPSTLILDAWKSEGIINKARQAKITKGKW